ncbi:phosphate ABC transporter permease [Pseudomonas aeruginosa]|nr:phosphate ABC transporter permease [Pseudomonas aeruginosa]
MKQKQETVKAWFGSGSPWVWMNAGAVSIAVIMTIGLLAVIAVRGSATSGRRTSSRRLTRSLAKPPRP